MENNQNINNFDAMLKQSLEGTQMPVPTGVWEAVGSSIGAKAIVAAKVASLKLLILKAVAGVVLAGGVGLGVYELLKSDTTPQIKDNQKTNNNNLPSAGIITDDISSPETDLNEIKVPTTKFRNEEPKRIDTISEIRQVNDVKAIDSENKFEESKEKKEPESNPVIKSEIPEKQIQPEKIKEPDTDIKKSEQILPTSFVEPPNVITPDGDNLNDCFKVEVENEKMFFLQIFDSHGKKVFETLDKNICWDGKNIYTGQACSKGVYRYKLFFELNTGFKRTVPGQLTLF